MKRYTEYICFRNASQRIVRVPYHLYHISIFLLFIKYNGRNVFFCFSHVMPLNCFLVRISKVYILIKREGTVCDSAQNYIESGRGKGFVNVRAL